MSEAKAVAEHYTRPQLEETILGAMKRAGLDTEKLTATDLAPMDEFHVGGLEATKALAEFMGLKSGMRCWMWAAGLVGRRGICVGARRARDGDRSDGRVCAVRRRALTKLVHLEERRRLSRGARWRCRLRRRVLMRRICFMWG